LVFEAFLTLTYPGEQTKQPNTLLHPKQPFVHGEQEDCCMFKK